MAACWEPGSLDVIHGVADMRVPEDLRKWFGELFASFPDFSFEVLEVIAERRESGGALARHRHLQRHRPLRRAAAQRQRVDVQGCDVLTVRDGKVVHNDAYMNGAEMARQLGALPPQGSPPEKAMTAAAQPEDPAARRAPPLSESRRRGPRSSRPDARGGSPGPCRRRNRAASARSRRPRRTRRSSSCRARGRSRRSPSRSAGRRRCAACRGRRSRRS